MLPPLKQGNVDAETVEGFGEEWTRFNFEGRDPAELDGAFAEYFSEFPWASLPPDAQGFDAGCGTGRWAERVAGRVGKLYCVDASEAALAVARRKLSSRGNCEVVHRSIEDMPFADESMDFGYSLGVLHHMPNTSLGLQACVKKLKRGAPFLLYLYYSLDNRPTYFRAIWQATDAVRKVVSSLPSTPRQLVSDGIAACVYWPMARAARAAELFGADPSGFPLSSYRNRSFYIMRNDALDRFGTKLEQRFSRAQIKAMMESAGLTQVRFREEAPFWCAVGTKA